MKDLNFSMLEQIVSKDNKSRYHMLFEPDKTSNSPEEIWWIRANQGHSLKSVVLDLQPIESAADIPTGTAVHGTTLRAWELIREQGLSKMKRNHIHLAQGVPGSGVISGMRNSSQILIYINVQKALDAGIKFYISANGVVLTEGDEHGHLSPQFFAKVETADRKPIPGWEILPEVQKLSKPTTVEAEGVQGAGAIAEDITKNSLTDEPQTTEALVL
ncbi:hypothetical protein AcV7_009567 [Taiwanofungus camphoratus]|nr:hypothetical protein AcV7_009567 [Antrodia cinnamomea]